jgi:Flp pilus assembly protein TadD
MSSFNLNEFEECISDLNKVIERSPEDAEAFYFKGQSHFKLGQKPEACRALSQAGEMGKFEAYDLIKNYCK